MKKFSESDFVFKMALTNYLYDEIEKEEKVTDISSLLERIAGKDLIYSEHVDGSVEDSFSDIRMVLREDGETVRTYMLLHFMALSDELTITDNAYDKYNPGIICKLVLLEIPVEDVLVEDDIVPSVRRALGTDGGAYFDKCEENRIDLHDRIHAHQK